MDALSFSSCIPPLCVVLTSDRVVEALSRYWITLPVFQTSPASCVAGATPAGIFSDGFTAVEAANACSDVKLLMACSCAKALDGIPFKLAAFTPVTPEPLPLKDDAVM